MRFIEADKFQVFVMGHSCGLSDRKMLNTIFEHPNCVSIKIFYYGGKEGYTNTTQEISRHFRDKNAMREKIVPFQYCTAMPQCEPAPSTDEQHMPIFKKSMGTIFGSNHN